MFAIYAFRDIDEVVRDQCLKWIIYPFASPLAPHIFVIQVMLNAVFSWVSSRASTHSLSNTPSRLYRFIPPLSYRNKRFFVHIFKVFHTHITTLYHSPSHPIPSHVSFSPPGVTHFYTPTSLFFRLTLHFPTTPNPIDRTPLVLTLPLPLLANRSHSIRTFAILTTYVVQRLQAIHQR